MTPTEMPEPDRGSRTASKLHNVERPYTPLAARPAASGFDAYRSAVRRQWLVVALVAFAAVATAVAWTVVRSPTYETSATLLAAPLPATNETFIGIDVLRESADSTRTIQTAAAVLDTREAAEKTAALFGKGLTTRDVQDLVAVTPEGQTNIIDVTAQYETAEGAAALANAFVDSALGIRRERIKLQAAAVIDDVRRQLRLLSSDSGAADDMQARIPQLTAVRNGIDPTLAIGQTASPPEQASSVPAIVLILLSLFVGLVVGTGVAVWADATRRRGATQDELLASYPIPLLAHVPRTVGSRALRNARQSPAEPTPQAAEAYRSVLTQLHSRERSTLMVTSASQDDGKTHVALGLATVAAAAGLRVALVDFDLRHPAIGDLLELPGSARVRAGQLGHAGSRETALVEVPGTPGLAVLAFRDEPLTSLGLENGLRNAASLIAEISRDADLVVVDTPPLGEVSDALRIAGQADEVLIVARPDHTSLAAFSRMRDLLERAGHPASGMVVIGGPEDDAYGYPASGALALFEAGAGTTTPA